jgi:hypothetical protein
MATLEYPIKKSKDKDDWFKINVIEYVPGKLSTGDFGAPTPQGTGGKTLGTILLPMPYRLPVNSTSTSWDGSTLNPLETAVGGAVESFISGGVDGLSGYAQNALEALKGTLTSGGAVQAAQAGLTQMAIAAATGKDPQQFLARFGGVRFNENVELAFGGMTLRNSQQFQFQLTPREKKESDRIKEIVRYLKINMSPKKNAISSGNAVLIGVPNLFDIQYMRGTEPHPFLNTFKLCALEGLSLDLSDSGYATYHDGTPVSMILTLAFRELTPIYQEDYTIEAKGKLGVGY